MTLNEVKALTFDTGGTILDWHSGFALALAETGARHGEERNWAALANELRRRSLKRMLNLGANGPPTHNFDDAHRSALEEILGENGLDTVNADERRAIWWDRVHALRCWPDFPQTLPKLREKFLCVPFTILSVRMIVDTARRNSLTWDAVISCEAIGIYKTLRRSYEIAAKLLQLEPSQCCMVACHNNDLDAARGAGFMTAFVRRPDEWGDAGSPDPIPNPANDVIADDFPDLARQLGVAV